MVLDLFLPRTCIVCGRTLGRHEDFLCIRCEADLPRTGFSSRPRNPMADRFNEHLETGPYAYATALFNYDGNYENLTKELKYKGDIPAGRHLGKMLAEDIAAAPHFSDVEAVIPVPLHWTRRLSRGYNQAEIIAREVASVLRVPCLSGALVRVRRTRTQTKLKGEEKARNVSSAFRADGTLLSGALESVNQGHLLLIDDVFTTGSTLAACAGAIRAAIDPGDSFASTGRGLRISAATLAVVPSWR